MVVGGTGGFGARLVRGLIDQTAFNVIIATRSYERCKAFAAEMNARAESLRAVPVCLDRTSATANDLRVSGADVIVDAAGPFQGGSLTFAKAVIGGGLAYVDLADARDFVAAFPALDEAAKAAGACAVSGASSTPALSNAALDEMTAGWQTVRSVHIAILPGNRSAPRGLAVLQSILSYAGQPVRLFLHGAWTSRPGWSMTALRDIPTLGKRWGALCETPDLDIVPDRFRVTESAIFRAGLELTISHFGLYAASLLVRAGLVRNLRSWAPAFQRGADMLMRFGSDRGGMIVEATGIDSSGKTVASRWTLIAEAGDGPAIPSLPALAVLRALADGRLRAPGAYVCAGLLRLADIEKEFAPYRITTNLMTAEIPK